MIRFRLPFAAFTAWLVLLFNLDRLLEPINIASFIYLLGAACGLAVLVSSYLVTIWLGRLVMLLLPILLALKYALGYSIGGASLPITLVEFFALAITVLLARWAALGFHELRTAVFCNLVSNLENRTQPFDSGQGELYREVRRARLFKRPLAFLAVAPTPGSLKKAKDRFTEEVMKRMLHQYVTARLADLLSRRLKDCDVIAQRNRHFIAALPETCREMALTISHQLQAEARKELGIELKIGLCTCPDEDATFVGLLERAEEDMRRGGNFTKADAGATAEIDRQSLALSASNGSAVVLDKNNPLLASSNGAT